MKFIQLIDNLRIKPNTTSLQIYNLVDKNKGIIVEVDNVFIDNISSGVIYLDCIQNQLFNININIRIEVHFNAEQILKHDLNQFLKGDVVSIVGRLISFQYQRYDFEHYPNYFGFDLISIAKDNALIAQIANKKEVREAYIESEANSAGIWGAIKMGIKYGIAGFIFGSIIGIVAGNTVAIIIIILSIIIGGFIGYAEDSQNKRESLRIHSNDH